MRKFYVFFRLFFPVDTSSIIGVGNTQELDLGIAVRYVLDGVSYYVEQMECISKLKNKIESVPAMTTDELKQVGIPRRG